MNTKATLTAVLLLAASAAFADFFGYVFVS